MEPLRICIGYDPRQSISYTCLAHSILAHSTVPITITPLVIDTLPIPNELVGLTPFTFTRYLTPWVCGFEGKAVFLDSDIVVVGDIKDLFEAATGDHPVWCVKHKQQRFEWPSVMVFDCGHPANAALTPEYVEKKAKGLPGFSWLKNGDKEFGTVGSLPHEWNHLVMYDPPSQVMPKLIHYTAGIPVWPEVKGCEHEAVWTEEMKRATVVVPWDELMGQSVHVPVVKEHLIATGQLTAQGRDDGSAPT